MDIVVVVVVRYVVGEEHIDQVSYQVVFLHTN